MEGVVIQVFGNDVEKGDVTWFTDSSIHLKISNDVVAILPCKGNLDGIEYIR